MSKEKAVEAPVPVEDVKPSGAWLNAARGDVYVDGGGKEHVIHGVVTEGFDAICDGKPENFRLFSHAVVDEKDVSVPLANSAIAAVNAWKRKG